MLTIYSTLIYQGMRAMLTCARLDPYPGHTRDPGVTIASVTASPAAARRPTHASIYILHTFQSVSPPHGQWLAPMGSWRVASFFREFSFFTQQKKNMIIYFTWLVTLVGIMRLLFGLVLIWQVFQWLLFLVCSHGSLCKTCMFDITIIDAMLN